MKVTKEWLNEQGACSGGVAWFTGQKVTASKALILKLMKDGSDEKLSWANWLICRVMSHADKVRYAIFAAEQVIGLFEKKYPGDDRPRKAFDAAKAWVKNPTEENKKAADAAAYAAYAADAAAYAAYAAAAAAYAANAAAYAAYAANAAYAAYDAAAAVAANAAAYAANAAAYAANAAAYAANAAACAANAAACAANADDDARKKMKIKILKYGIGLLK